MRQVDPMERMVVFLADNGRSAGKTIRVDDIKEIHGELVDYMDNHFWNSEISSRGLWPLFL